MADLDDIEDLFHKTGADGDGEDDMDDPLADIRRVQGTDSVLPKARRPRHSGTADEVTTDKSAVGLIPGTGNVYIKTWGCAHNNSDGEYMAGLLSAEGYNIVKTPETADLWVLNSCTVKNPSEGNFLHHVQKGRDKGVPLIVAGCVPQGQPKHSRLDDISMIGVGQIERIAEVAEAALQGNTMRLMKQNRRSPGAPLDLPKVRKNNLIEIIPINSGCLNQCTYCKTKAARGDLRSYPVEEIVQRVESVQKEGIVEIWLTSEDTGTYGRDIGSSLPELLWAIIEKLRRGVRLRLGMTNPPYIREHLPEMVKVLNHPQVYKFLHIPVQAASDEVLENMKRKYTIAEFCEVCDYLLERVPGLTLATDIICGFPGETPEQWEETMDLIRKYRFPVLNISQFYPRPGTPAARMKRVHTAEVKRRSRALTRLFEGYRTRDAQVGEIQEVLATELARDGVHFAAHNLSYDQILVPAEARLRGKLFQVRITEAAKHYMRGDYIPGSEKEPEFSLPDEEAELKQEDAAGNLQDVGCGQDPDGRDSEEEEAEDAFVEEEAGDEVDASDALFYGFHTYNGAVFDHLYGSASNL